MHGLEARAGDHAFQPDTGAGYMHPVEGEHGPAIRLGTRVDELLIEMFGGFGNCFGPSLEELLVEAAATRAIKLTKMVPHGGWPMAAGPVSRLGSFEPGDKTGLRLSPHLHPAPSWSMTRPSWSMTRVQSMPAIEKTRH